MPLLSGVLIIGGYRWYDHHFKAVANRDLVALVLRTFSDGIGLSEPLPVQVDRTISRADLLLLENDVLQLSRLLNNAPNVLDPWGAPLRARRGEDWLEIRSAGPDGEMDTPDDTSAVRPYPPPTTAPRSIDRGAPVER